MAHDKQDKTLVESRSRIGMMSFEELKKHIGVDSNPGEMDLESGTANGPK